MLSSSILGPSRQRALLKKPTLKLLSRNLIRDPQGKLLVDSSLDTIGYMQPTKATLSREARLPASVCEYSNEWTQCRIHSAFDETNPAHQELEEERLGLLQVEIGPAEEDNLAYEFTVVYLENLDHRELCYCSFCGDFRAGRHIQIVEDIQERTRCHDNFYKKPSFHICIPFKHQVRFMKEAYAIAQKTFYYGLEKYWPGQEIYNYPHGPESVRFGTSELQQLFGDIQVFSDKLREHLYPD
ncbi:hypothetical protein BST61_g11140 [Cercospora zeina]